jgi:hypothetical protein
MSETILFISYKLIKGASVEDFLLASEKLNNEYMSKQKGYISWKQLNEGDVWVDMITFECLEDAKKVEENSNPDELALAFYSFINLPSCKIHYYTVERSY